MILAETYIELLTNRAHWMFELTVEFATTIVIGIPLGRLYQRWHDRKHHTDLTPTHEGDTIPS